MNKIQKVVLDEVIFDRHKVVEAELRIFALRANGEGSFCITGQKTTKTWQKNSKNYENKNTKKKKLQFSLILKKILLTVKPRIYSDLA
jgi:hypothetical protein